MLEPIDRGLCLLRSWGTGKRAQQYYILGDSGSAKEAQTEFLVLLEESIRQPNLSKSVQRYQFAVDEAKGAPESGCGSWNVVDACSDGFEHWECRGL